MIINSSDVEKQESCEVYDHKVNDPSPSITYFNFIHNF